jgi:ArsR family transcriptional regulator
MPAAQELPALLKLLGDTTRLRILALIATEEVSVGELSRALGMSQSRVSNHLRLLRKARWIAERHSGPSTFLRIAAHKGGTEHEAVWSALRPRIATLPEHRADLLRLEALFEERAKSSSQFFDRVAADWDKIGLDFASGQARQRAAASLVPRGLVFADVGCGTGYMARALLGIAERIICVDRSRAMLDQARAHLARDTRGSRLDFRFGELDALPIQDGELDGLVAAMVLHHLPALEPALHEMLRVLKPGAPAIVLELAPHKEGWMRETLGDRHLGLEPGDVLAAFERSGFEGAHLEPVDDHYQPRSPSDDGVERHVQLPMYLVRGFAPRHPVQPANATHTHKDSNEPRQHRR